MNNEELFNAKLKEAGLTLIIKSSYLIPNSSRIRYRIKSTIFSIKEEHEMITENSSEFSIDLAVHELRRALSNPAAYKEEMNERNKVLIPL